VQNIISTGNNFIKHVALSTLCAVLSLQICIVAYEKELFDCFKKKLAVDATESETQRKRFSILTAYYVAYKCIIINHYILHLFLLVCHLPLYFLNY